MDGNKRLAWLATYILCAKNELELDLENDDEAYDLVVAVAAGELYDVAEIAAVLTRFVKPSKRRNRAVLRSNVAQMRPTKECGSTPENQKTPLERSFQKPSDGLEPSTPSLPWQSRDARVLRCAEPCLQRPATPVCQITGTNPHRSASSGTA